MEQTFAIDHGWILTADWFYDWFGNFLCTLPRWVCLRGPKVIRSPKTASRAKPQRRPGSYG